MPTENQPNVGVESTVDADVMLGQPSGKESLTSAPAQEKTAEQQMAERLQRVEQQSSEAQILAKLMMDPDFAEVLKAKQQGKRVKIMSGEDEKPTPAPEPMPENLDDLPPRKLAEVMVKQTIQALQPLIEQQIAPLRDQLSRVDGHIANKQKEEAVTAVEKARAKYPDFQHYVNDMTELSRSSPSLSIDELYMIAKRRKLGDTPAQPQVETERPSSSSARPSKSPAAPGQRGFQALLTEALERVNFNIPID